MSRIENTYSNVFTDKGQMWDWAHQIGNISKCTVADGPIVQRLFNGGHGDILNYRSYRAAS